MDPLARRRLGQSPLEVTVLGLGGAPLGDFYARLPEPQAETTLAAALDAGVGLFDTAPLYGQGLSEHRVGRALRGRAHDFVLSTKVGRYLVPEAPDRVDHSWFKGGLNMRPVADYSYDGARRAIDQSFQRLGLERIDVLLIHDVDIWTHGSPEAYEQRFREAMEGAYRAIHQLRAEGVIGAIGIGVNEVEPCLRFAAAGDFDCMMLAGRYTLLEHAALDALLPEAERRGFGLLIAGPYNSGILATGTGSDAKYNYRSAPPEMLERVRRIEAVCHRHGVELPAAALQFPLAHKAVSAVVPGAVTADEVRRNLAFMAAPIPSAFWSELKHERLLPAGAPVPG